MAGSHSSGSRTSPLPPAHPTPGSPGAASPLTTLTRPTTVTTSPGLAAPTRSCPGGRGLCARTCQQHAPGCHHAACHVGLRRPPLLTQHTHTHTHNTHTHTRGHRRGHTSSSSTSTGAGTRPWPERSSRGRPWGWGVGGWGGWVAAIHVRGGRGPGGCAPGRGAGKCSSGGGPRAGWGSGGGGGRQRAAAGAAAAHLHCQSLPVNGGGAAAHRVEVAPPAQRAVSAGAARRGRVPPLREGHGEHLRVFAVGVVPCRVVWSGVVFYLARVYLAGSVRGSWGIALCGAVPQPCSLAALLGSAHCSPPHAAQPPGRLPSPGRTCRRRTAWR